jgi:hypothetical protein
MSIKLIASKALAVLQILLGAVTTAVSWDLVAIKEHTAVEYSGPHLPANTFYESPLLYVSLTIAACGLLQWMLRVNWGRWQVGSGLVSAFIATFLLQRQNSYSVYLVSPVYYFACLPAALGMFIFVTGFVQLITEKKQAS